MSLLMTATPKGIAIGLLCMISCGVIFGGFFGETIICYTAIQLGCKQGCKYICGGK